MKHLTQKDITRAFNEIYQTTGNDLQSAREECGDYGPISQQEIIEVCCDQMYSYGGLTHEQLKEWEGLDYHDKVDMGKLALPYEYYE